MKKLWTEKQTFAYNVFTLLPAVCRMMRGKVLIRGLADELLLHFWG